MADQQTQTYCFSPHETRSFLAGLRVPQVAALAAGGVVSLVALRARPDGAGLGACVVILAAAALLVGTVQQREGTASH